jgi:hypothetical protein
VLKWIFQIPSDGDDQSESGSTPSALESEAHASSHTLERLEFVSSIEVVDSSIGRPSGPGPNKWECRHAGCKSTKSWRNKDAARNHVRKHLKETRLFRCVEWCVGSRIAPFHSILRISFISKVFFASEKNATRHRDNQTRRFSCDKWYVAIPLCASSHPI